MTERTKGEAAEAPVVRLPVDLVEFETRLLALERRLREQEARDQWLLEMARSARRLTEALGPLLEAVTPASWPASGGGEEVVAGRPHVVSSERPAAAPPERRTVVSTERLAWAHERMREVAAAPLPATEATAASEPAAPAQQPPPAAASFPPPGRRSWLLRALRRMVAKDPQAAGRLLSALLPAYDLALLEPLGELPGPPETMARIVVGGRLRRRLGWERAQLHCNLTTVSALARLVRLQAPPLYLHAAGVRVDPPLALQLLALAIDRRWTVGHRFTIAHRGAAAETYLEVRNGARPAVSSGPPATGVATAVRCPDGLLLPLLAGAHEAGAFVEGERRPLDLACQWFAHATGSHPQAPRAT